MDDNRERITLSFPEDEEYLTEAVQVIADDEYKGNVSAVYRDLLDITFIHCNQVRRHEDTYELEVWKDDEQYVFELESLREARQASEGLQVVDELLEQDANRTTVRDYLVPQDDR